MKSPLRMRSHLYADAPRTCVGAGLLLAWLFGLLCFEGLILHHPNASDPNRHDPFFLATVFSIAACGVLTWLLPRCLRAVERVIDTKAGIPIVCGLLVVTTFVMGTISPLPLAICILCGCVAGVGFLSWCSDGSHASQPATCARLATSSLP